MDSQSNDVRLDIQSRVVLAPHTSWLVGGEAEFFCKPRNLDELLFAQRWAQERSLPITTLGGGSNVLISDYGVRGLVIALKSFSGTQVSNESGYFRITALSGTGKSELLKIFLKEKLAPALFLAGIPGDVGGGVVMNAGVAEAMTPREFTEITEWIEVLKPDGSIKKYQHDELTWSYRHSTGWEPGLITRVGLRWPHEPDPTILDQVRQANKVRLSKQPLDMPSCGSVFMNPPGLKAAQLIDSSGLKGYTVGGAQVSMKHANFIVNLGKCKATDIWTVIQHVKAIVKQEKSVDLKTEVVRVGDWDEETTT
ncbi:MAG: UDP-N-acetylmuramate dehydrogenase [Bdellovibrio sp.]